MKRLGPCHVQPLAILCTLLTAGFLLVLWRGTAPAQQLDPAEVTHREYQEFILATGRVAPDHWDGTIFPPGSAEEPVHQRPANGVLAVEEEWRLTHGERDSVGSNLH